MAHRIRTSEITIFVAFVLFSVGWLSLRFVRDPLPVWEHVTQAHPGLLVALDTLDVAGIVSTLAILAGGLPLLASALLGAARTRRWNIVLLFAVPVVAVAALVGYALLAQSYWAQRQSAAPDAPLTPLAVILQFGFLLALVVVVVASTAAVAGAIGRSEVSERALRFALLPGGIATVAMGVGLVAGLALLALIVGQAPRSEPGRRLRSLSRCCSSSRRRWPSWRYAEGCRLPVVDSRAPDILGRCGGRDGDTSDEKPGEQHVRTEVQYV